MNPDSETALTGPEFSAFLRMLPPRVAVEILRRKYLRLAQQLTGREISR